MTATSTPGGIELAITFLYYRDLPRAEAFWRDVMGLELVIDQGHVAKIFRMSDGAHIGLVDAAHGMNDCQADKCVQVCLRVADVDAWYTYARSFGADNLSEMFENDHLGIRAFVFDDTEGIRSRSRLRRAPTPDTGHLKTAVRRSVTGPGRPGQDCSTGATRAHLQPRLILCGD